MKKLVIIAAIVFATVTAKAEGRFAQPEYGNVGYHAADTANGFYLRPTPPLPNIPVSVKKMPFLDFARSGLNNNEWKK
jgi:hypothetical protein